eukprot:298198-Alexandrium_andersonii.AAC.1
MADTPAVGIGSIDDIDPGILHPMAAIAAKTLPTTQMSQCARVFIHRDGSYDPGDPSRAPWASIVAARTPKRTLPNL